MTDEELVAMLWRRDPGVLELLQQQYGSYCGAITRNILGNTMDAEECCADTWMEAWCHIPPAKPVDLRLYLGKTARNLALHRIEYAGAQKRCGATAQLDELAECIPDSLAALDAENLALKDAINRFLQRLKPEHRNIFLRRYWFGDSIQELCKLFNSSESRITGILLRCRRQLKKFLEKEDLAI